MSSKVLSLLGTNTPPTKDRNKVRLYSAKGIQVGGSSNDYSDFWGGNGPDVAIGYGYIGSNGSYNLDFMCNGYRNAAGEWTTLNINGNVGRANISLSPAGYIDFRVDNGDAVALAANKTQPPVKMNLSSEGYLGINTQRQNAHLYVNGSARIGADSNQTDPVVSISQTTEGGYIESFKGNDSSSKEDLHLNSWGGNVGVGTNNATSKLRVGGGDVHIDNNRAYLSTTVAGTAVRTIHLGNDDNLYLNAQSAESNKVVIQGGWK